jgi:hypothetical protein
MGKNHRVAFVTGVIGSRESRIIISVKEPRMLTTHSEHDNLICLRNERQRIQKIIINNVENNSGTAEIREITLARLSINCKLQTRPLVREGTPVITI